MLAVVAGGVAFGVVRAHRSPRPVAALGAPAPASSPSARPGPGAPPWPPYQWLSGRPWRPDRPVLAVKIDNVGAALPQVGLDAADVVYYLEQVEYGLTRLMAIYSSTVPPRVGPVRSARTNDLELLAQYGRPVLAFSGANAGVAADVARADLVDASADLLPAYFGRDHGRPVPHNLFLDPVALLRNHRGDPARDVGLRFGPAGPGGQAASTAAVPYPSASVVWTWDRASGRFLLTFDGRPDVLADGTRVGATNVVLQYVRVHPDVYVDVVGNVSPYSVTVGSGEAVVLRGGRALSARWSRPGPGDPTRLRTPDGRDVPLGAGQTWVLLVPVGAPVTVR